jgi:hypothetical protein
MLPLIRFLERVLLVEAAEISTPTSPFAAAPAPLIVVPM